MDITQNDFDALRVLGHVFLSNGKHEKARTVFEGLDALRPNEPDTLRCLSYACLHCGLPDQALARADACLAVTPPRADDGSLHLLRSRALMAMGRDDEARGAAAKYLLTRADHRRNSHQRPERDNG